MAKDKENTERQSTEPVANCDQLPMAIEHILVRMILHGLL